MRIHSLLPFAVLSIALQASAHEAQATDAAPPTGNEKVASGLKQALEVGTTSTVFLTGKTNGNFGNPAIKILMP